MDDQGMMAAVGGVTVLIVIAILFAIFLIPAILILRKAGYSGWWVLLYFIPLAGFIGLWVFALADWPALKNKSAS